MQVKTLDKLFEYYCLLRLLKLLADHGYQKQNMKEPVFKYNYISANRLYQNEREVANTYMLSNGSVDVTLYYQPVISAYQFENNLTLYRTTSKKGYYTPDFVLKFYSSDHNEEYIIFDAKFSNRNSIIQYMLPKVILEYSCEFGVAADIHTPKMVWILQGRVNINESPIWRYHDSPLALKYYPYASYGIVSMNTAIDVSQRLWNEIRNCISFLK